MLHFEVSFDIDSLALTRDSDTASGKPSVAGLLNEVRTCMTIAALENMKALVSDPINNLDAAHTVALDVDPHGYNLTVAISHK